MVRPCAQTLDSFPTDIELGWRWLLVDTWKQVVHIHPGIWAPPYWSIGWHMAEKRVSDGAFVYDIHTMMCNGVRRQGAGFAIGNAQMLGS